MRDSCLEWLVDMSRKARSERAAERAARMSRIPLGEDGPLPATGLDRIELAWMLSKTAWVLSGKSLPSIPRAELPIRRMRKSDADG
jgi:hypothetical protein